MTAKQTLASASLVVALGGARLAQAEPAAAPSNGQAAPPSTGTGTLQLGAGYRTDDGFFARATIAQANLFGTGDLLALDAMISARRQLFQARFAAPHVLDSDERLDATLYTDRRILPGFARAAAGGTAQLSRQLDDHVTAFLGYRFEHVMPDGGGAGVTAAPRQLDPTDSFQGLHAYNLGAVRAGIAYSTLDTPFLPRRGSSVGASVEIADRVFGSQIRYTRADAWAGTHQPLGPFTFHLGGRVSAIGSPDRDGVPTPERLFLDGSRDLPGFLPGGLGPPVGGNFEALGRAELELPLTHGLSVVGFYAAGALTDWHGHGGIGQSAGIGLRWRSPIGPIELDLAIPIGSGGSGPGFVLGLGGSF